MLFFQLNFLIFFAIVFAVHWSIPSNTWRKAWLLLVSHIFYACFFIGNPIEFWEHLSHGRFQMLPPGWWFPMLLIGSTTMDYFVGLGIEDAKTEKQKRIWLFGSLFVNLGVLAWFKYFNFFQANAFAFAEMLGMEPFWTKFTVFLPYGISFYTFQSLSYSIEVYRKKLPASRSFLDLAFFVAFFPQVVAGPIVRAMSFLPQTLEKRVWSQVDVRACLTLFFIGFVKKACISENLAPFADQIFENPDRFDLFATWIGVLFYAGQIYCDFSGYSDMAIACARMLGYELTVNFDFPYFSRSVTEFWRRWHISLSTWLRDYLYISLGGNRGSKWYVYRNLMLTMVLGGLWHGAAWTFVIWGALHGLALVVHKEWTLLSQGWIVKAKRITALLAVPLCFYWILITWTFFRARDVLDKDGKVLRTGFDVARTILDSLITFDSHGKQSFSIHCATLFAGLAVIHWLCSRKVFAVWWRRIPDYVFAALLGAGFALALYFMPVEYKAFIYFQF